MQVRLTTPGELTNVRECRGIQRRCGPPPGTGRAPRCKSKRVLALLVFEVYLWCEQTGRSGDAIVENSECKTQAADVVPASRVWVPGGWFQLPACSFQRNRCGGCRQGR